MRVLEALLSQIATRGLELERRDADFGRDAPAEAVHQLRVALRRMRAVLEVFRPFLLLPPTVRIRPLRRLERGLGALRDMDVLSAMLAGIAELDPPSSARLEHDLARDRSDAMDEAVRAHRRAAFRHLLHDLSDWVVTPATRPSAQAELATVAPDLLLPGLSKVFLEEAWTGNSWPDPSAPESAPLHHLRRQVKRLRYQVECLAPWYGARVTSWLEELHAIQDAIGAWHDVGLLLARVVAKGVKGPLRERLLADAAAALAPWPAWRRRYLDPAERARLRGLLLAPLSAARPTDAAAGGAA